MTQDMPSSDSPPPISSPQPKGNITHVLSNLNLNLNHDDAYDDIGGADPPPSLLSPAFTPPSTPGTGTPAIDRPAASVAVDSSTAAGPAPRLLEKLPEVECIVRARIPTVTGADMYLHLYSNNIDKKEHMAIVFGEHIRSKSLYAYRPGETEQDRMMRGAYEGRLYPGRTSSRDTGLQASAQTKVSPTDTVTTTDFPSSVPPLVRIHSECYTGETVWSARCDCGEQLDEAARLMSLPAPAPARKDPKTGSDTTSFSQTVALSSERAAATLADEPSTERNPGGVIVYLRQEGRGIGLSEKLKAYNLQDLGSDTVEANIILRHPADARTYGLATAILLDLGLGGERGIRLLTNNPDKIRAVEGPNREVRVVERVAMVPLAWKRGYHMSKEAEGYMKTKIEKMSHMFDMAAMQRS